MAIIFQHGKRTHTHDNEQRKHASVTAPTFMTEGCFNQLRDDEVFRRMANGEQFLVYDEDCDQWSYPVPYQGSIGLLDFPTVEQMTGVVESPRSYEIPKVGSHFNLPKAY